MDKDFLRAIVEDELRWLFWIVGVSVVVGIIVGAGLASLLATIL